MSGSAGSSKTGSPRISPSTEGEPAAPRRAARLHNRGVRLAQGGDPAAALALFDAALALRPGYARAHVNRGGALEELGRCAEAAEAYRAALEIAPGLYRVHLRRALVLLALDRRAAALRHFARTRAHRRDPAAMGADHPSFARASRLKLLHDAAQFRHLEGRGAALGLAALYDRAAAGIDWPEDPAEAVDLPRPWRARLAASYNRAVWQAPAPEVAGGALRPGLAVSGGVTALDGVLRPEAFAALRRHLLESTIWHDFGHVGGFLAAYLEDGLACPVLLQIAAELRAALPESLGPHMLRQAWAFKCLTGAQGIDVHADSGAVSVNLWMTPDSANLAPGSGGLVVHTAPPPAGWAPGGLRADAPRIRAALARAGGERVETPYAANRAVVFPSRLFHESAPVRFREGYENHRINVTLLYGAPAA